MIFILQQIFFKTSIILCKYVGTWREGAMRLSENCSLKCANRKDEELSSVENYEQPTSLKNLMIADRKTGEMQNCSIGYFFY